eukprot:SM000363S13636  [mRNA]  locus=s363:75177:79012:+ [translate_table: standard]
MAGKHGLPSDEGPAPSTAPAAAREGDAASWAHPIAAPEAGSVLLAHPRAFGASQTYFNQASPPPDLMSHALSRQLAAAALPMLRLLQCSLACPRRHAWCCAAGDGLLSRTSSEEGSVGVILNRCVSRQPVPVSVEVRRRAALLSFATSAGSARRPTEHTLAQLAGFEEVLPELGPCPLYIGGDVGNNCTHVIHGHADLDGAKEVINGVYVGGYGAIRQHVRSGRSSPSDYRWFARYSGWGPGQLERELQAGVWFLGSCSTNLVLKQCIRLPKPLWREVLELMGGQYAEASRRAYGEL